MKSPLTTSLRKQTPINKKAIPYPTANKSNFAYMKNRILLTLLLLTNIYNLMAQEDSYLWLEEVDGKKALEFVEKQNKSKEIILARKLNQLLVDFIK